MRNPIDLLTVPEVARLLRVRESTVYTWAEAGLLPCHRVGRLLRFDRGQVLAWLDRRGTGLPDADPARRSGGAE